MPNFPTSLDSLSNPAADDYLNSPSHAAQHSNVNDIVEALEAKLGIGASTPAAGKLLYSASNGQSSWGISFLDEDDMASDSNVSVPSQQSVKKYVDDNAGGGGAENIIKNGDFINNSTNGYGGTPDDWSSSNAHPVQGGTPALTKQNLIDILGIADGDIEGLWNFNNSYSDLSSNGYNLTASGSPVFSDDGLMAKALDLEASSSQKATIASAANLNITGSQTFFAFFKPESFASNSWLLSKRTGANHELYIETGQIATFYLGGLTTNTYIASDVKLEAGKWYMIVGVYDSANSLLKIWVNGVKKQVTASGSATGATGEFAVGTYSGGATYADGMIQNAGVLSVALSDAQVKKLFANTMYKGIKIRRATTDAYIYQSLPESLVERLRGKTISITAKTYQQTASTAQVSIYDGSTETESTASATTDSWINVGVSAAIASNASEITIRAKVSDSDANAWFKEILLYEGDTLIYTWNPSKDDLARFPRLMNMDFPLMVGASPYQYEENRWHSFTPSGPTNATMTGRFMFRGKECRGITNASLTGAPSFSNMPLLPIKAGANIIDTGTHHTYGTGGYLDSGTANTSNTVATDIDQSATVLRLMRPSDMSAFSATIPITWASGDAITAQYSYEID